MDIYGKINETIVNMAVEGFKESVPEINAENLIKAIRSYSEVDTQAKPDSLLTVDEVANRLGCSTRTVYNLINDGVLAKVKIRRSTRISEALVDAYIESVTFPN